jgi:TRAP-type C4-dicarboxylate transport system permease small subunit
MNLFRGILMLAAGAFVIYQGWRIQTHQVAAAGHWPVGVFYVLGALAIGLGVWRLLKKPPKPLV